MDKIQLLQQRKAKLTEASKGVRESVAALVDEESFVELSAFSFSKNEFFNEEVAGEGVVTGFATVDGYPFYVVAQNFKAMSGGVSKANCDKIAKCLDAAEKNATPVIYVLNTLGVQVGEGVTVLEGLAKLLLRATQLKGVVPQYVVVDGEVYGSAALLSSIADFTFFIENKSVLAINSPFVLSAKLGKNVAKEEVGGAKALADTGLVSFTVSGYAEIREKIASINDLLASSVIDAELNESAPFLNESVTAQGILSVLENVVEPCSSYESDVKTLLCRIGGIAAAVVLFDGGEDGVELDGAKLSKIKKFVEFASCYALPLVVFDNVKGAYLGTNSQAGWMMSEAAEYLNLLDTTDCAKISVVFKKAVGLGYSLFAAKSVGFDYTCAFANAKIALFDGVQGAQIELADEKADKKELAKKYADENSDPIHAAKDGYIDAIIEPQFVKQYLIASLQMLAK